MKPDTTDFGSTRWAANQAVTSTQLQNTALIALKTILDGLVGPRHADQSSPDSDYESGFFGAWSSLPSQGGSTLEVDIAAGAGLYSRADMGEADGVAGASAGDAVDPADSAENYRPNTMVFGVDEQTVTLGAHDATNPRIDVIYGIVTFAADDAQSVLIYPIGGPLSSTSTNQRIRWKLVLSVAAGTPAGSPTVPSIPAHALRVAHVYVPATSGSLTIKDARTLVRKTGTTEPNIPDRDEVSGITYARDVLSRDGLGTGFNITTAGTLTLTIAGGRADIDGARRRIPSGTVTLTNADATNPRWDLVWVKSPRAPSASSEVGFGSTAGTAASTPSRPSAPAGCTAIAYIYRAANDNAISSGEVYDVAPLKPYTTADHVHFSIPIVHLRASVGPQPGSPDPDEKKRIVTLTAYDQNEQRYYGTVTLLVQTWGDSADPANIEDDHASTGNITLDTDDITAGTVVSTSSTAAILRTDQFGKIEDFKVVDPGASGGSGWLTVRAIRYLDASDDTGTQTGGAGAYISGSPNVIQIGFR